MSEKYYVFKKQQLIDLILDLQDAGDYSIQDIKERIERNALKDAEVIRSQDILAAPGLYAYAATAQSMIELLGELGYTDDTAEQVGKLSVVRDYFFQAAQRAQGIVGKRVPD